MRTTAPTTRRRAVSLLAVLAAMGLTVGVLALNTTSAAFSDQGHAHAAIPVGEPGPTSPFPPWDPTVDYRMGQNVIHDGHVFRENQAHAPTGQPPNLAQGDEWSWWPYWQHVPELCPAGTHPTPPSGFTAGEWPWQWPYMKWRNQYITYASLERVVYDGLVYEVLPGQQPSHTALPTDTTFWRLVPGQRAPRAVEEPTAVPGPAPVETPEPSEGPSETPAPSEEPDPSEDSEPVPSPETPADGTPPHPDAPPTAESQDSSEE